MNGLAAAAMAPKRERDLSTGQLRFRWSESGALEHFRHAHAFDHLASFYVNSPVLFVYVLAAARFSGPT